MWLVERNACLGSPACPKASYEVGPHPSLACHVDMHGASLARPLTPRDRQARLISRMGPLYASMICELACFSCSVLRPSHRRLWCGHRMEYLDMHAAKLGQEAKRADLDINPSLFTGNRSRHPVRRTPGTSTPYDIRASSKTPPRACSAHGARALDRRARRAHHLTLLNECMSCTPPSACRRGGQHSSVAVLQESMLPISAFMSCGCACTRATSRADSQSRRSPAHSHPALAEHPR